MTIKHTLEKVNMNSKTAKKSIERIDNNCFECAYCVKHYYNVRGTFQLAKKKRIANKAKCEYWQPEKVQIEKRRESIKEYLRTTAEKLNEIAQILKEDNEHKNSP